MGGTRETTETARVHVTDPFLTSDQGQSLSSPDRQSTSTLGAHTNVCACFLAYVGRCVALLNPSKVRVVAAESVHVPHGTRISQGGPDPDVPWTDLQKCSPASPRARRRPRPLSGDGASLAPTFSVTHWGAHTRVTRGPRDWKRQHKGGSRTFGPAAVRVVGPGESFPPATLFVVEVPRPGP